MNELEIKNVPFLGTELMAARDADGQIWAGVRWMCEGMGLSDGQTKNERLKIQKDKALSKGGRNFVLNESGYGNREVLCLKLDFVPLWLAKISITPTMETETPELTARLEQYQLRAKDVLAAAFLPEKYGGQSSAKSRSAKTESQIAAETKRATAMILNAKNRTAERFQRLWDRANVKPEYQALALGSLFAEDGVNLPRIALQSTKVTYDKGTIAERLGVFSRASGGKVPHAQAIGAIIAQLDINPNERESVPYSRNGHDGIDEQFSESVVEKIYAWLEERKWPATISNGNKSFGVIYRKQLGEPGNG